MKHIIRETVEVSGEILFFAIVAFVMISIIIFPDTVNWP